MHLHLALIAVPVPDADTLDAAETTVLAALDPPLNLAKRPASPRGHSSALCESSTAAGRPVQQFWQASKTRPQGGREAVVLGEAEAEGYPHTPRHVRMIRGAGPGSTFSPSRTLSGRPSPSS